MIDFAGYGWQLFQGTIITILVAVCALIFGLCLSVFGTLGELSRYPLIRHSIQAVGALLRGLPELLDFIQHLFWN